MSKRLKIILIITGAVCVLVITLSVIFYMVVLPIMRERNQMARDEQQSNIKKECYIEAKDKAIKKGGRSDGKYAKDDYDTYYKWCLQERGL